MHARSDLLPTVGANATGGQLGEAMVEVAILEKGHLYSRLSGLDFGVDGTIEFVTRAEQASGQQVGVQVKRGLSAMHKTGRGRTLYFNERHANYWLGHSLPVIVVHVEPETRRLRWQHANEETIRKTVNGFAIDLPEGSDLPAELDQLHSLATTRKAVTSSTEEVLAIPYDPEKGVTMSAEELGLAALAFSRAALRGERCRVEIEVEGEADLVASIDVIRDTANPRPEDRRAAVVGRDMLHDLRKHAETLRRALTLLLTDKVIAELFGYHEDWLGEAIRRVAPPMAGSSRELDFKSLEAWPDGRNEQPVVKFEASQTAMDEFYARDSFNRDLLHAGNFGGVMVGDFPREMVTTRFLPSLARRLLLYADTNAINERDALARIGVRPSFWLVGVA